ncbi:MAG TPA: RNA 2',3'-cyclic phosphodiesterase, partial [Erythrobacter sp.]|nr:RNA 2',3'-cyclic phosphodiesterase [Erythrobacter sp.]
FRMALSGTGIFARSGRTHTLWAGVEPNVTLQRLRRRIEQICVAAGVEPDHRKYHPHVTLARTNRASGSLEPFLARTAGLRLGPWEVDAYLLYESFLRPEGSVYEPVMRYALEPE